MKKTLLLALLCCTSAAAFAQSPVLNAQTNKAIDSIVAAQIKEYAIVGLSIGIVQNGESTTKHYGTTDASGKYPVTDATAFHLASISKLFAATAIMQLVEEGKIRLTDKLADLLPDFTMKDSRYTQITLQHLLTHTSGLMWDNKLKKSPDSPASLPLYVANLRQKRLNFAPGTRLSYKTYSNVAFDLLGIVVEKVSGIPFEQYVQTRVLGKANMSNCTYFFEKVAEANLAAPQFIVGHGSRIKNLNHSGTDSKKKPVFNGQPLTCKTYPIYGEDYEHNPSGNLIASAKALNVWMLHHLAIYQGQNTAGVLRRESLSNMWQTQQAIPGKNTSIGLGWWITDDPVLGKSVFHVGSQPGFCTILMIYPEKNFGMTILCNGTYAKEAVWRKLFSAITNLCIGGQ